MTDRTIDLDKHRGMAARKATGLRRLRVEIQADQAALKARQDALETMLEAAPAAGWPEAVEKARYLLGLFAQTPAAEDPRRRRLVADVLSDFDRLLGDTAEPETLERPFSQSAPRAGATAGDETMAKGEQRGNRESKKPKREKPATAPAASPFAATGKSGAASRPPGGKK